MNKTITIELDRPLDTALPCCFVADGTVARPFNKHRHAFPVACEGPATHITYGPGPALDTYSYACDGGIAERLS